MQSMPASMETTRSYSGFAAARMGERMTPAQEYRLGVRAAVGIIAVLCLLCGLAALAKC